MKLNAGLVALVLVGACTPAAPGPEAVVEKIYQPLVDSKGESTTSLAEMPLSDELKALVDQADAVAKDEPVFDGDFAGNCQDCAGFSGLRVTTKGTTEQAHTTVEASFRLAGGEARSVTWDMLETPQGWRVDNIVSAGIDLRKISQEAIEAAAPQPAAPTQ